MKDKNKALKILYHADKSEKKLKEKLSSEFDENIIERVIDFLKSYNLVNDSVLAQKIVNTNVNLNKCGKNRIKQNLYNKGINRSTINEAVSELDKDTEFE
ncbi:regulatory protein RecX, partial [Clostridioides difficile]|uniref:regulatory protein RecX n=1 Tax=Clostridioides difficile TaxID=1496 RepID=UPI0029C5D552